jgi:signal transduction histidine kinase
VLIYALPAWVFPDAANLGRVGLHGAVVAMQITAFVQFVFMIVNLFRSAEQLEENLASNVAIAEEASGAKSRFLANMSREFRTPLNAIPGFSDMMRLQILGPMGNSRYQEYCVDIHRSAEHLLALFSEILDLSRVAAGKMELAVEEVDVVAACEEALSIVGPLATANGNALSLTRASGPRRINTDPDRVAPVSAQPARQCLQVHSQRSDHDRRARRRLRR